MSLITRPRFVALDTSQLGALARDTFSAVGRDRKRAEHFERALESGGGVLLLSWHHVQELLAHRDKAVLEQRSAYVRSLPLVAVIKSVADDGLPGSVIDLQAWEVAVAFRRPGACATSVRDQVATDLLRLVSGSDVLRPFIESWSSVQPELQRHQEKQREIVAITRSAFVDASELRIMDLLRGAIRPRDEIAQKLRQLHGRLTTDIRQHGDRRIADPEASSAQFFDEVWNVSANVATVREFIMRTLTERGISPAEIGPDTTVGDIGRLATFRHKLALLNTHLGLPWAELKASVTEDQLPCGLIQAALAQYRPHTREWKGSDMTDGYLACLSAYADITYVDKRTHEAFRVATRKSGEFEKLARRVEKASRYEAIAEGLSRK